MTRLPPHIERILDEARWAPSGDNQQSWRFEVAGDEHVVVHGFDTRDHVVYDLDGHASQLALGALLETIATAATVEGRTARMVRRPATPETHLLIDVRFERAEGLAPDPLAAVIRTRTVQRRAMSPRALTLQEKSSLAAALPDGYRVLWFEGWKGRWRVARLMVDNAKVRLTIPEAYEVHRSVIEWGTRFSSDRIPDQALGVDPLTARFMRWAMASWQRVEFLNKYMLGHVMPRVQMDLIPGLLCAAHFALLAPAAVHTIDEYIAAGRVMQRFWLTAARLGLHVQPEMTPLIFSRYHREGRAFTRVRPAQDAVGRLAGQLTDLLDREPVGALFFMGRIGAGPAPRARSTRRALDLLIGKPSSRD